MIETRCEFCFREFGYEPGAAAICVNCGMENQPTVATVAHCEVARETAMVEPEAERAMVPAGQAKRRKRR